MDRAVRTMFATMMFATLIPLSAQAQDVVIFDCVPVDGTYLVENASASTRARIQLPLPGDDCATTHANLLGLGYRLVGTNPYRFVRIPAPPRQRLLR